MTDRPAQSSNPPATESDEDDTEGLALVDTTQHQAPDDITETSVPTRSSTTATTSIENQTQTQGVTTRMEATSTRTYAPDNYDRTLMKLPSDDASKIFAGMKSDNDVVMTPDYAKKVFSSKSSAQRLQAVKIYSGIVVVILLSIAVFGTFEFQQQSSDIETSLRSLKRDPMPGIIQLDKSSANSDLFTESGVDSRTIEMIASADDDSEMVVEEVVNPEASVVADEGIIAGQPETTDDVVIVENVVAEDNAAADVDSVAPEQGESVATTQVASIDSEEVATAQPEDNTSTLKIITSSQIEQKDLWLREAYAAYKSGNESLALTRYNQVLEVDPGNRNALLARAAINVQNNNSDAAIRDYRTLLLHNPKDSLAMSSFIAVANLSPRETESQLKLMIRDEPDSPYLNFALANAYGAQQRWQEAQGYYFKALEYNPSDPNYAYNLAVSLEHIAQPRAAILYYQRALKNFGNSLATFNRDIVSQRVEILAKK